MIWFVFYQTISFLFLVCHWHSCPGALFAFSHFLIISLAENSLWGRVLLTVLIIFLFSFLAVQYHAYLETHYRKYTRKIQLPILTVFHSFSQSITTSFYNESEIGQHLQKYLKWVNHSFFLSQVTEDQDIQPNHLIWCKSTNKESAAVSRWVGIEQVNRRINHWTTNAAQTKNWQVFPRSSFYSSVAGIFSLFKHIVIRGNIVVV